MKTAIRPMIRNTCFLNFFCWAKLREYLNKMSMEGMWNANAISATYAWLKEGLRRRCIKRDLKWGVLVPLEKFKDEVKIYSFSSTSKITILSNISGAFNPIYHVFCGLTFSYHGYATAYILYVFYVWFDAPIG